MYNIIAIILSVKYKFQTDINILNTHHAIRSEVCELIESVSTRRSMYTQVVNLLITQRLKPLRITN